MAQAKKRFFSEDEKTVAEIRDRFLKVNNGRIRTVRNALKQRQQVFLDILPLLLHYNEVQLPGYVRLIISDLIATQNATKIRAKSLLVFGLSSALRQTSHMENMLPLARLEGEPKSGAIIVSLFIFATLK